MIAYLILLSAAVGFNTVAIAVVLLRARRRERQMENLVGVALDCRDHCYEYRGQCRTEADAAHRHANDARRAARAASQIAEDFGVRKPQGKTD